MSRDVGYVKSKARTFGGDQGHGGGDLEGLEAKVGYLKKKNSHGVWQRRHVRLQNKWLLSRAASVRILDGRRGAAPPRRASRGVSPSSSIIAERIRLVQF